MPGIAMAVPDANAVVLADRNAACVTIPAARAFAAVPSAAAVDQALCFGEFAELGRSVGALDVVERGAH
jgi:hypothetical protein